MERFVISIRSISFSRETAAPARCWPACLVGVVARHRAPQSVQLLQAAAPAWLVEERQSNWVYSSVHLATCRIFFFVYNMNNKKRGKGIR